MRLMKINSFLNEALQPAVAATLIDKHLTSWTAGDLAQLKKLFNSNHKKVKEYLKSSTDFIKFSNTFKSLNDFLLLTNSISNKQINKKNKIKGAKEIYPDIYHVYDKDAACLYGKGTKWCITGKNYKKYFSRNANDYKKLFIITKSSIGKLGIVVSHDIQQNVNLFTSSPETYKIVDIRNDKNETPSEIPADVKTNLTLIENFCKKNIKLKPIAQINGDTVILSQVVVDEGVKIINSFYKSKELKNKKIIINGDFSTINDSSDYNEFFKSNKLYKVNGNVDIKNIGLKTLSGLPEVIDGDLVIKNYGDKSPYRNTFLSLSSQLKIVNGDFYVGKLINCDNILEWPNVVVSGKLTLKLSKFCSEDEIPVIKNKIKASSYNILLKGVTHE